MTTLTKPTAQAYSLPSHAEVDITIEILSKVDEQFAELMSEFITESGLRDELDFEEDTYLESFDFSHKLNYILQAQETELACYKTTLAYYRNNKD